MIVRPYIICALAMALFLVGMPSLVGQSQEKHRVRLKADYIKHMDARSYLDIKASARINKQTTDIGGIELLVVNEIDEDKIQPAISIQVC